MYRLQLQLSESILKNIIVKAVESWSFFSSFYHEFRPISKRKIYPVTKV